MDDVPFCYQYLVFEELTMYSTTKEADNNTTKARDRKFAQDLSKNQPSLMTDHHSTLIYQSETASQPASMQSVLQIGLLQAVIESFVDGILILTTQRELVHGNECARRICRQLLQGVASNSTVPKEIWLVCQSLMNSHKVFPRNKIFIESEVNIDKRVTLRIQARWLQLTGGNVLPEATLPQQDFLLVTLEDRNQTSQGMILADAMKYGLTDREAEVWLLRRANLSYKEISARLYITINTVKKHIKNIYAKQQELLRF
jgi:DNA-binding CsgD family transcriptional regulator